MNSTWQNVAACESWPSMVDRGKGGVGCGVWDLHHKKVWKLTASEKKEFLESRGEGWMITGGNNGWQWLITDYQCITIVHVHVYIILKILFLLGITLLDSEDYLIVNTWKCMIVCLYSNWMYYLIYRYVSGDFLGGRAIKILGWRMENGVRLCVYIHLLLSICLL